MRLLACVALLLLPGCMAPAPPLPAAPAAQAHDGMEVVAFRVEANETRVDRLGSFELGFCGPEGCSVLPFQAGLGWEPWTAELQDRGLFWRVNATFSWVGEGPPARMAAYLLLPAPCNGGHPQGPCWRLKELAAVEGGPPLRLVAESFEEDIQGIRLYAAPVGLDEAGGLPVVDAPQGRWTGVIQAFHRAPGAEDIQVSQP